MAQERLEFETLLDFSEPRDGRVRTRSVVLDWEAVDLEALHRLKKRRGHAKGELTKAISHVVAELTVGGDVNEVEANEHRLMKAFGNFKESCNEYRRFQKEEEDVEECLVYFQEAEKKVSEVKERIAVWRHSRVQSMNPEHHQSIVASKDSVSQVKTEYSRRSLSSKGSRGSKRTIETTVDNRRLSNAVKMASLQAEVSVLDQHEKIAKEELRLKTEEMRLNQMRRKLELDTEMAKISAEDEVCAVFQGQRHGGSEAFDLMGHIKAERTTVQGNEPQSNVPRASTRIQPVFGTSGSLASSLQPVSVHNGESKLITPLGPVSHAGKGPQLNPHASPWECIPQPEFSMKHGKSEGSESGVDYLRSMRNLATAALLPRSELTVFDGNPLNYFLFVRSFENNVEMGTNDHGKRLQLLIQFCSDKARKSIENCILLEPKEGYKRAKAILAERFGNPYIIANSWMKKVCNGSQIKPGDREGLQDLADELEGCEITLKATGRLAQLNNEDRLVKVLERCPTYVKSRWQSRVQDVRLQNRDPTIADVRMLIRKVANEKNDPVYGSIMDSSGKDSMIRSTVSRRHAPGNDKMSSRFTNFSIGTQESAAQRTISKGLRCFHCDRDHRLENCDDFKGLNGEQQFKLIRARKLCDNCLSTTHYSPGCKKSNSCTVSGCEIKRKHLTTIHDAVKEHEIRRNGQLFSGNRTAGNRIADNRIADAKSQESRQRSQFVGMIKQADKALDSKGLSIVPVKIKSRGGKKVISTYALLDCGSTASFCSDYLLKKLGVNGKKCQMQLATIDGVNMRYETAVSQLQVMDVDESVCIDMASVFSTKTLNVSKTAIATNEDLKRLPNMQDIKLPSTLHGEEVNLLIGVDVPDALQPLEVRKSKSGGPFAVRTIFGWALNGPLGRFDGEGNHCHFARTQHNDDDDKLDEQLCQYFNHEFNESSSDTSKGMSVQDKRALAVFEDTLKFADGHYQIAIPWKIDRNCLPNNLSVAQRRLTPLKKRLLQNPDLRQRYTGFIDDLIDKRYARRIPPEQLNVENSFSWYLPHHNVVNPKKPDKVRIVFDCAATYQGTSLNDNILQGPDLTNKLVGVLCRFRQESVVLTADIEAMYHQVRVDPIDANALKFLWYPDGDLSKEAQEYQMLVHPFGGIWSSSCVNFALRRTAHDNATKFDSNVIEAVRTSFYVDDLLKSMKSSEEAIRMQCQLSELLQAGGFHLTKWSSNRREVLDAIPESERAKELRNIDLSRDVLPVERTLGMEWDIQHDIFKFNINKKERPATRRGMLSIISSVYDPIGFASPFTLKAKMMLQSLCQAQMGWDEEIVGADLASWNKWLDELPSLEQLKVDRCLKPPNFGAVISHEIHTFSDASEKGYGAASYLRSKGGNGEIHCAFLLGKSRLAPLKRMTIPRLELSAATLAARLDAMLRKELEIKIDKSLFWTDSTATLRYISNETRRFHTFVANRVGVILDCSSRHQWRYVPTQLNPADDASRGLAVDELLNGKRWNHGPEFLWKPSDEWPCDTGRVDPVDDDDVEVKKIVQSQSMSAHVNKSFTMSALLFCKISDWTKLKKTVAWILRFKRWILHKAKHESGSEEIGSTGRITVEELRTAEACIVQCAQMEDFGIEFASLKDKRGIVKKTSSLRRLDPMIINGLLCVGGRMKDIPIEYDYLKHPWIIPKGHCISSLIIHHYHQLSGHSGQEFILSALRERYWIIQGRSAVKRIVRSCFDCKRRKAIPLEQKMADLPTDRVTPERPPFTFTGIDCFGPFFVKKGRSLVKRYGVIFTCLSIRAIHIEVANSLDTSSFINSLRRFMARRGVPEEIRSDNGTNFKGAERDLRASISEWNQQQLHGFCLQRHIRWKFNPPAASHMGGVWERLIRTIRRVLSALVRNQVLDDEGLRTFMCEAEAIINARPLTRVSDDPQDLNALTPNHLLLLRSNTTFSPGLFSKHDQYVRRRWKQIQYMTDQFWKRWVKEYLPILQERQKWFTPKRNLANGDIVLVADKGSVPRNVWPIGRVIQLNYGRDALVRSVRIKTMNGELVRPIDKLCLLEAHEDT